MELDALDDEALPETFQVMVDSLLLLAEPLVIREVMRAMIPVLQERAPWALDARSPQSRLSEEL